MSKESSKLNFDFFETQIQVKRLIHESSKSKIELIQYNFSDYPCIKKQYFNRDLCQLYEQLKEIKHPNLPYIYQVLYYKNDTYIIEEYIEGKNLKEEIEERKRENSVFTEEETYNIVNQLCLGLMELHSQNPPIIHRDIKPENIIRKPDNTIKLIDFDIAREYKEAKEKDTQLFGTEEYASPEHFGYGQTSEKSDIYSIGVLLHEMLTGKRLLADHNSAYEGRFQTIIEKCIEIDPKKRYQTVEELQYDLEIARKNKNVTIQGKRKRKKSALFFIVFVSLLAVSIVIIKNRFFHSNSYKSVQNEIIPNLWDTFKNDKDPREIIEASVVQNSLKTMFKNKYSNFMKGLTFLDDIQYNARDDYFFISGRYKKDADVLNSSIAIHQNGEIECGFFEVDKYQYYAENEERYKEPSIDMLKWLIRLEDYPIYFMGKQAIPYEEMEGMYIGNTGYLNWSKNSENEYEITLLHYNIKDKKKKQYHASFSSFEKEKWFFYDENEDVWIIAKKFYNIVVVVAETEEEQLFDGFYFLESEKEMEGNND